MTRWARLALLVLPLGCSSQLDLGSDVSWAAGHESGTLDDWLVAPGGGSLLDDAGSTVEASREEAHSGRYSLKISDFGASDIDGPGMYRELVAAPDAYYSAWYFLPREYQTHSQWTIQKFRWRSATDPTVISHGYDLNLRTLPGGEVVLYVFSHNQEYLQAPLAAPPAFVPIGAWFHLEALYRPRNDETGQVSVWLDDRLVYDLRDRRTAGSNDLFWSVCSVGEDVTPSPKELFVDDVAISRSRVTRSGRLF